MYLNFQSKVPPLANSSSSENTPSRYVVGFDLGTTNSAVTYVDSTEEPWQVRVFAVPGDLIDPTIKGGGGTSFKPIWRHLEGMVPPAKCVVVLTDLEGEFGDDPGVPVIWCVFGNPGRTAPFGEVVYVE